MFALFLLVAHSFVGATSAAFQSRPELTPPAFNFSVFDADRVSPGYILIAPYTATPGGNLNAGSNSSSSLSFTSGESASLIYDQITLDSVQNGPYIYDTDGTLIWSGYGSAGGMYSHDVKLTSVNGKSFLTFFNGVDPTSGARGQGVVLDTSYRTVDTIHSGNGRAPNDIHEFTLKGDGTALTTVFEPTHFDLQPEGLNQPWGYVVQGIAQELEVSSGTVLFEWQAIDHVNPFESYHPYNLSDPSGNGTTAGTAWDFFHLNSIDKFSNGDYLLSSRYMCALYRVDGKTGDIVWQLGGMSNQFKFVGFNETFAFQHHARIRSENSTTTVISIFDNGSDGYVTRSKYSSGILMAVNTATKTCTLLEQYYLPDPVLATSQGSTQYLSNGNVFMGWGIEPYISEFAPDGECLMAASFGPTNSATASYRAFKIDKGDWIGTPESTPAIWSYANSTSSPNQIFTSWNGATEIASWRFYGQYNSPGQYANSTMVGSTRMIDLGTVPKQGFETVFAARKYYPYTMVEALDNSGNILGQSPLQRTYVVGQNSTAI